MRLTKKPVERKPFTRLTMTATSKEKNGWLNPLQSLWTIKLVPTKKQTDQSSMQMIEANQMSKMAS